MSRRLTFQGLRSVEAPLLPAGMALGLGILISDRLIPQEHLLPVWSLLTVGLWAVGLLLEQLEWGRLVLPVLLTGFLTLGAGLQTIGEAERGRNSLQRLIECGAIQIDDPVELRGEVVRTPELAPDRIYLHFEMEQVMAERRSYHLQGVVRLAVPFNDDRSRLEYDQLGIENGSRLRMLAQLRGRRQYGNPGAPPFDEILESQGIAGTGWVRSPLLIEILGKGSRNRLLVRLEELRAEGIRTLLRHIRQPAAGLLVASLFGNRYFLSRQSAEPFRAGGTFHLLVISGMHMALIAIAVLGLMRRVVDSRAVQYLGGATIMWGYALMVGAEPAVARSVIMLSLTLAGQYIFRPLNGANSLAVAAAVMLAWEPGDLFNPGFQVTFLTIGVIVFLTGPLTERLREIGQWRPMARTPWPPRVSSWVRILAEILYWDGWGFQQERRRARIRYRLFKTRPALLLSKWRLQPVLRWTALTILTTIGVQIALLPMMIAGFHRVSLLSPLINVVEALLVTALMAVGALYLILHLLLGDWIRLIIPLIDWLGRIVVDTGETMAGWPGGGGRVPDYGDDAGWLFGLYGAGIVILILVLDRWNPLARGDRVADRRQRRWLGCAAAGAGMVIAVIGLLLVTHPIDHQFDPGRLSLTFLDVGQGDAIVITFPKGRVMMVDSGGDRQFERRHDQPDAQELPFIEDRLGIAEAAVLPYLWSRGIEQLDVIVASHGDNDHVGGFLQMINGMRVVEAWQARGEQGAFTPAMLDASIPVRTLVAGERVEMDGVRIDVLSADGQGNNGSLVLRLRFGERSFLLTGDIERQTEMNLVGKGLDLRTDVLKVAHHGSKTSTTAEFLERTDASIAVISAGAGNSFGHPHQEVIDRLRSRGLEILETSRHGAITISTDGRDLKIAIFSRT